MPRTVSDEELQLRKRARRRLVGAVALVLLAAVLLPMALDGEPKQVAQDIEISIPAKDQEGTFRSKVVPLPETPALPVTAPEQIEPQAPATAPTSPAREPKTSTPPDQGKSVEPPPAAEEKLPPPVGAGKPEAGGYVVQLGAFSNPANVKQIREKLSATGIPSYTEKLKTGQGEKTRVRAGPFPTREAAEKAGEKLKKMGLNGIVAPKSL